MHGRVWQGAVSWGREDVGRRTKVEGRRLGRVSSAQEF